MPNPRSITEAWKESVQRGQKLNETELRNEDKLNEIFKSARESTIDHIKENDHGFYRPDIDPHYKQLDGGALKRKRLVEQPSAGPGSSRPGGQDDDLSDEERARIARETAERNARDQAEVDKRQAQIDKEESPDAGLGADVEAERTRRSQEARSQEADADRQRRAEVADQLASSGARGSRATDPRRTGTRGSAGGGGFDPSQRNPADVRNPGRDQAIDNILDRAPEGSEERKRLDAMSDEELAAEVDTQAKTDFGTKMDKIEADEAEREGLSVADYRDRTKKRQGRMKDFDKMKDDGTNITRRRKFTDEIEEIEAQAKAARRAGDKEKSIELYRKAHRLRRNTAADRSEYAREGEDSPDTTTGGDGKDTKTGGGTTTGGDDKDTKTDDTTTGGDGNDTFTPDPDSILSPEVQKGIDTAVDTVGTAVDVMSQPGLPGQGIFRDDAGLEVFEPTRLDTTTKGLSYLPRLGYEALKKTTGTAVDIAREIGDGRNPLARPFDYSAEAGPSQVARQQEYEQQLRADKLGGVSDEHLTALDITDRRAAAERNRAQGNLSDEEFAFQQRAMGIRPQSPEQQQADRDSSWAARRAQQRADGIDPDTFARQDGSPTGRAQQQAAAAQDSPPAGEAQRQAAATRSGENIQNDPVTGNNVNTTTPPASIAKPPPASPPNPDENRRPNNFVELQTQSYNPTNKYGVTLFEAKGPLQR